MSDEPKTLTTQVWAGRVEVLVDKEERVIHKISFELPPGFTFAEPTADGAPVVARDEAAELRAGFDKVVYRLDDALKEAAELRQAITEFITARREHFYYTVNESGLDVAEYNRTASRYEAALETLQRIGEP